MAIRKGVFFFPQNNFKLIIKWALFYPKFPENLLINIFVGVWMNKALFAKRKKYFDLLHYIRQESRTIINYEILDWRESGTHKKSVLSVKTLANFLSFVWRQKAVMSFSYWLMAQTLMRNSFLLSVKDRWTIDKYHWGHCQLHSHVTGGLQRNSVRSGMDMYQECLSWGMIRDRRLTMGKYLCGLAKLAKFQEEESSCTKIRRFLWEF